MSFDICKGCSMPVQQCRCAKNAKEALDLCERLAAAGYRLMQLAGGAELETGDMQFACKDGVFSEPIAAQRIRSLVRKAQAVQTQPKENP